MYQIGELIFYGSTGVCRVADIHQTTAHRTCPAQTYYILQPLYSTCTIQTPVDNPKVFMRPILSREEALNLIDRIPTVHAKAYSPRSIRELSDHYEAAMRTHNSAELLKLTMSIYAKKQDALRQNKKFGSMDERFMKRAEDLLFGELAAALDIDRDTVPDYIASRLEFTLSKTPDIK